MANPDIPSTWSYVGIEDCLTAYDNGKKIRQGWSPQCERFPAVSNDDWGVLKTSAIQDGVFVENENKHLPSKLEPKEHLVVKSGDILMTCAGPRSRCGVACLVRKTRPRLLISGKMYQLRCDPNVISNSLLELFLRESGTQRLIDKMKTGISDSGLNLTHKRFNTLRVPLPPVAEQKRIVTKIEELFSELDAGEDNFKQARKQLGTYRQSLLKQAFEGKLTEQWRADNPDKLEAPETLIARIQQEREARHQQQLADWQQAVEQWEASGKEGKKPVRPKKLGRASALSSDDQKVLPTLPEWWAWCLLGEMCEFANGDRGKNYPNRSEYVSDGIPWINTGHIEPDGSLSPRRMHFITREKFESLNGGQIQEGDLVYCLRGATFGKTAFVRPYREGAIASSLMIVRPTITESCKLIYHYLLSPLGKSQLMRFDNGSAQPNLSANSVRLYEFPLCSFSEQQEIVRILEEQFTTIEQNEREIDAALKRSEALRQSILKRAFSGQLVPQDPDDEPASEFLARIQQERSEHAERESLAKTSKAAKRKTKKKHTRKPAQKS